MRTSIILLIVLLLPFFLSSTDISYGSMATELTPQLLALMMKERIMTPDVIIMDDNYNTEILELPKTPKASPYIESDLQLRILMMKETIMTPDAIIDEGIIMTIPLPKTPLSSAYFEIDFNFIDDIMYEKQFVRHLMY